MKAIAQVDFRPGFIVDNSGDTTKGFVAYGSRNKNLQTCLFREEKNSSIETFRHTEIMAYGFSNGKNFKALRNLKGKESPEQFAEVLIQSELALYRTKEKFWLIKKDSLVHLPAPEARTQNNGSGPVLKKDTRYIGVLNAILASCPLKADKTGYSGNDLVSLVEDYNSCKNIPIIYKANQRVIILLNINVSFLNSNLVFDNLKLISFQPSTTLMIGTGVEVALPQLRDNLRATLDLQYANSFYQGYYEGIVAGNIVREDVTLDVSFLKIPVGLKYNLKEDGNTPYVRAGILWVNILSDTGLSIQESEFAGVVNTSIYKDNYLTKNPKAFWFGLGYTKKVTSRLKVFAEGRFEIGEGFFGTPVVNDSRMNSLSVTSGVKF